MSEKEYVMNELDYLLITSGTFSTGREIDITAYDFPYSEKTRKSLSPTEQIEYMRKMKAQNDLFLRCFEQKAILRGGKFNGEWVKCTDSDFIVKHELEEIESTFQVKVIIYIYKVRNEWAKKHMPIYDYEGKWNCFFDLGVFRTNEEECLREFFKDCLFRL